MSRPGYTVKREPRTRPVVPSNDKSMGANVQRYTALNVERVTARCDVCRFRGPGAFICSHCREIVCVKCDCRCYRLAVAA